MHKNIIYARITHRVADDKYETGMKMYVGESKREIPYLDLLAIIDKKKLAETLGVQPSDICFIPKREYDAEYGDDNEENDRLGLENE